MSSFNESNTINISSIISYSPCNINNNNSNNNTNTNHHSTLELLEISVRVGVYTMLVVGKFSLSYFFYGGGGFKKIYFFEEITF